MSQEPQPGSRAASLLPAQCFVWYFVLIPLEKPGLQERECFWQLAGGDKYADFSSQDQRADRMTGGGR